MFANESCDENLKFMKKELLLWKIKSLSSDTLQVPQPQIQNESYPSIFFIG